MKSKSAIWFHREFSKNYKTAYVKNFWSCGYFVLVIGLNEEVLKGDIREQEEKDQREDGTQLDMDW